MCWTCEVPVSSWYATGLCFIVRNPSESRLITIDSCDVKEHNRACYKYAFKACHIVYGLLEMIVDI